MEQLTYNQCLEEMYALGRFGIKLELSTVKGIVERLGVADPGFKTIHIAGTNGKGSTAAYCAGLLRKAGFKTGLYTSPHLVKFNERISIDGEDVSDQDIVEAYLAVKEADTGERKATFFEIATAMAFYLFHREEVQWAVLETGMGGRLDATNIAVPEVAVITNLSLEHTDYLGTTIEEIAWEKGGIIKANTPVVTGVDQEPALGVLRNRAHEKSAPLYVYGEKFNKSADPTDGTFDYTGIESSWSDIRTELPGRHQMDNAVLALAAVEIAASRSDDNTPWFSLSQREIQESIRETRWPGRLEYIQDNPLVILDGAHNLEAAKQLGAYMEAILADKKTTLVVGILDDKPHESMLESLVPHAHRIIVTRAKIDRSIDPAVLKTAAQAFATGEILIVEDVAAAVKTALETTPESGAVCIAGSLYVAGEARDILVNGFSSRN
ncbi:MAG: folylpolyglutamate synthase/dihydrofolate synthase family protein [Desulfobacteraceae bacterium]